MHCVLAAYLLGSLTFGVILGYLRLGHDIRKKDLPGGSGSFRQLGPAWGVLVALLDMAKGALAAVLGLRCPSLLPWVGTAVIAGHNWPVFFGFRGGGGLAPAIGFFLVVAPGATLMGVAVALLAAALYHLLYWRRHPRAPYPIPVGAVFGLLWLLYATWGAGQGVFLAALGATLAILLRALQMLFFRR